MIGPKKTIHAIRNELYDMISYDNAIKLCDDIYITSISVAGVKIREKKTDKELYHCGFCDDTTP